MLGQIFAALGNILEPLELSVEVLLAEELELLLELAEDLIRIKYRCYIVVRCNNLASVQ